MIIYIYYLADTAMIGLTVACCRTTTIPRDILEPARTTVENIVEYSFGQDELNDKNLIN